jgi:integrase
VKEPTARGRNGGLKKRCSCPYRQWAKCAHPWHFGFHHAGQEFRLSLHKVAGKSAGYWMSKSEAEALRDRLRADIREGRLRSQAVPDPTPAPQVRLTFGDVADAYLKRHVWTPSRRPTAAKAIENYVKLLRTSEVPAAGGMTARLETKPMDAITKADVEAVREARRQHLRHPSKDQRVRAGVKSGELGIQHMLATLRSLFNWAIGEGYIEHTPFKRNGVNVIRIKAGFDSPRTRRLDPHEETMLLANASAHLYGLIIAALETGCRVGELLSLQWQQVRWTENVLLLTAGKTKTSEARDVPMTSRLLAVLEMRRHAPDGREFGPDAYVFGNETGEQIGTSKTAWRAACRRAGIKDLHFHDLRREFASRLLESGASNHDVRDWLGHANITTTSRYLATTRTRLQQVRKRFEDRLGPPIEPQAANLRRPDNSRTPTRTA